MIDRLLEIINAPVNSPKMIWVLVPLIFTILLTEFYFSRYKYEEKGWEYFFGNSMILLFVSMDLLGYIYTNGLLKADIPALAFSAAIGVLGILLLILNFFHILPEQIAYGISSNMPINFLAYMAVVIVYSDIAIDYDTILASIAFLIMWSVVIGGIHKITPSAWSPKLSKYEVPEPEKKSKRP